MAAQGKLEFAAPAHSKSGKRNWAGNVGADVLRAGRSGTDTFDPDDSEILHLFTGAKRKFARRRFWIPLSRE